MAGNDPGILRVITPDGQVKEYEVDFDSAIVGRADGNRVVINDVSVSRRHAHLFMRDGLLMVDDLRSATGTFVSGQRVTPGEPVVVLPNMEIRFGQAQAYVRRADSPPASGIAPAAGAAPLGSAPVGYSSTPREAAPPGAAVASGSSARPYHAATPLPTPPAVPPPRVPAPVNAARPPAPGGGSPGAGGAANLAGGAQQQWLAVTLASPPVPIKPGNEAAATITVHNRGNIVDEISLAAAEIRPDWVTIARPRISLLPGARDEVSVVIRIPDSPQASAGQHPITVIASSRAHNVDVRAVGAFGIQAIDKAEISMSPLKGDGDFTVTIVNAGNRPASFTFEGSDDEGRMKFELPSSAVAIEPGQTARVPVEAKPGRRRAFGQESSTPFRILVRSSATAAEPVQLAGTLVQRPSLEGWKKPFIALMLIAGLGSGGYGTYSMCTKDTGICADFKDAIAKKQAEDANALSASKKTATALAASASQSAATAAALQTKVAADASASAEAAKTGAAASKTAAAGASASASASASSSAATTVTVSVTPTPTRTLTSTPTAPPSSTPTPTVTISPSPTPTAPTTAPITRVPTFVITPLPRSQ